MPWSWGGALPSARVGLRGWFPEMWPPQDVKASGLTMSLVTFSVVYGGGGIGLLCSRLHGSRGEVGVGGRERMDLVLRDGRDRER